MAASRCLLFILTTFEGAEYCVLEDSPKVADFCPKKWTEKDLEASASTVCAGWAGSNNQAHFVTPLHLEWEPTTVHFNSCRRWTEKHVMTRDFDPVFPECVGPLKKRWGFQLVQKTELVKKIFSRTDSQWEIIFLWNKNFPWECTSWNETCHCHCWQSCKLQRFIKIETA